MIRATLNLPSDRPIGKIEARQAVLMALMGSCEAGPLAKLLHDHMPREMARDLKSLVENNLLTVRKDSSLISIPLQAYAPDDELQQEPLVAEDGCLEDGRRLSAHSGLQAAFRALGLPAQDGEQAVSAALTSLARSEDGPRPSFLDIIDAIARQTSGGADVEKRVRAAFDAFAGAGHASLLGAWEMTFAAAAHNSLASSHKEKLFRAVMYGNGDSHNKDPLSLSSKSAQCLARIARVSPQFKSEAVEQVRRQLMAQLQIVMDERLCLLFDLGRPALLAISATRDPFPSTPSQPIEDAEGFKSAMKQLLREAESDTNEILRQSGDVGDLNLQASKLITDYLVQQVDKPGFNGFLKNVAAHFVSEGGSVDAGHVSELPWKIGVGRQMEELASIYFGKSIDMVSSEGRWPPVPNKPGEAAHIMRFILCTLWSMREGIESEVTRSPSTFHVPCVVHDEVVSLTPATFIDDWEGNQDPDAWIEQKLKVPAHAHVQAARNEPPLGDLLNYVAALIHHDRGGYGIPQVSKGQLMETIRAASEVKDDDQAYTLASVYEALTTPGVYVPAMDAERFRDCVASSILQVEPPPSLQIADTHRQSPTRPGTTDRLGILYNPFRAALNLHFVDDLNDSHAPVTQHWLDAPWRIMTTLLHDIDDTSVGPQ
jgi:hypothetical protein